MALTTLPREAVAVPICVLVPDAEPSDWRRLSVAAIIAAGDGAGRVRAIADAAEASAADLVLALDALAAATLDTTASPATQWLLTDAAGRPLAAAWPLLAQITGGHGIALVLWQRARRGAPWAPLRRLHLASPSRYRSGLCLLGGAVASLVGQALVDHQLGLQPAPPHHDDLQPALALAAPASAWAVLGLRWRGAWHEAAQRQRRRWLAEHWRIGVIEAPIHTLLAAPVLPAVRWLTEADGRAYWADPMAMGSGDRRLFCEYFDEQTGLGHLERLDLDASDRVVARTRLDVGGRMHASFPLVIELDGRRFGLAETGACRECVLHEVGDDGHWRPLATLLDDVALADPAIFSWEGRYWLAATDVDRGALDNLCLWHADRIEGPWTAHANNPVKRDVRGARMAGGFFGHAGALYRPAQDCLASYGAATALYRVERCTPNEYTETLVRRLAPDAAGPCPDGLHTVSAWGERTLVDGKRHAFSLTTLLRKLGRGGAPSAAPIETVFVYIPHLRLGGGETSLLRLAQGFARRGLRVALVVHTLATAELAVPPGIETIELHRTGTAGALLRLVRLLRQRRPDVLLSAFPHTNIAAVVAVALAQVRCRCVVSEHAPLSQQIRGQGGWRYRLLPPLVRWAYRRAAAVVAVSQGVRADLEALVGPGLEVQVIGNPVLPDDLAAAGGAGVAVHAWFDDPSIEVVLSVSRLSAEKDIPTLIRALALLRQQRPGARLLIAGDGPERARLEALVAELGLMGAVQLVGRLAQPLAWMRRSAAFALASRYEGFGNVLVEALASGLPVVSTDCPVGPREILQDGRFGELVPIGDAPAMAQALARVLARGAQPPGAHEHALRFTEAASCAAYRRVFDGPAAAVGEGEGEGEALPC